MRSHENHRAQGFARRLRASVGAAALFAFAVSAQSQTINGSIDTSALFSPTNQSADGTTYYNAPYAGPFPAPSVVIGEFDFVIPGGSLVSAATFSGDFGSNILGSSTAEVDLFVNSVEVASCDTTCALASESNDVPWSHVFTAGELVALGSGAAVLTAIQQGQSQIVLDPTAVSITVSAVPVPAEWLLLVGGALPTFLIALRRRQDGRPRR